MKFLKVLVLALALAAGAWAPYQPRRDTPVFKSAASEVTALLRKLLAELLKNCEPFDVACRTVVLGPMVLHEDNIALCQRLFELRLRDDALTCFELLRQRDRSMLLLLYLNTKE